jgi:hypothetical protein
MYDRTVEKEAQTKDRTFMRQGGRLVGGFVFAGALLHTPGAAPGTTSPVTNPNDSGANSLRHAIMAATASAGTDTITISISGIVTLTSPLPVIGDGTTIIGPGADQFGVDGAHTFQAASPGAGSSTRTAP